MGAGELAQQLRALAAPARDTGSVPSTHVAANNSLELQLQELQCPPLDSATQGRCT